MGREAQAASVHRHQGASDFHKYIVVKIAGVHLPVILCSVQCRDGCTLDVFQPVNVDEITSLIASLQQ